MPVMRTFETRTVTPIERGMSLFVRRPRVMLDTVMTIEMTKIDLRIESTFDHQVAERAHSYDFVSTSMGTLWRTDGISACPVNRRR